MNAQQITIDMALKAWNIQVSRMNSFLEKTDDTTLAKEVAPGRNTGTYLLGHLIAVNDTMISLFGLGERLFSHFDEDFIKSPDKKGGNSYPTLGSLRENWKQSNEQLDRYFSTLSADEWFGKHTSMSDDDWAKDPARNKLSVFMNRTAHMSYHLGQLAFLK